MSSTSALAFSSSVAVDKPTLNTDTSRTIDYKYGTANQAAGTYGGLAIGCHVLGYSQTYSNSFSTIECDIGIAAALLQDTVEYNHQESGGYYYSIGDIMISVQESVNEPDTAIRTSYQSCSDTLINAGTLTQMTDQYRKNTGLALSITLAAVGLVPGTGWAFGAFLKGISLAMGLYNYLAPPGYTPKYSDNNQYDSGVNIKWEGYPGYGYVRQPTDQGYAYLKLYWDTYGYQRNQQIVLQVSLTIDKLVAVRRAIVAEPRETISTSITLDANPSWVPTTNPSGRPVHGYPIMSPPLADPARDNYLYPLPGYHVDTIGTYDYPYEFFAYTHGTNNPNYDLRVRSDGTIEVKGWFRQDDTFTGYYSYLAPGRRQLALYVIYSDSPSTIAKKVQILDYTYGNTWTYKDVVIDGLTPGRAFKLGIGRVDAWLSDWGLVAEWAGISILAAQAVDVTINAYPTTDTNNRYHGMSVDQSLPYAWWNYNGYNIEETRYKFTYSTQLVLDPGSHYIQFASSGYVYFNSSCTWHAQIYINGVLTVEGDEGRDCTLTAYFTVPIWAP